MRCVIYIFNSNQMEKVDEREKWRLGKWWWRKSEEDQRLRVASLSILSSLYFLARFSIYGESIRSQIFKSILLKFLIVTTTILNFSGSSCRNRRCLDLQHHLWRRHCLCISPLLPLSLSLSFTEFVYRCSFLFNLCREIRFHVNSPLVMDALQLLQPSLLLRLNH